MKRLKVYNGACGRGSKYVAEEISGTFVFVAWSETAEEWWIKMVIRRMA